MLTGTCHCGTIGWTFDGVAESVTSCNCTLCRRYGALWIYDFEGGKITLTGPTQVYTRVDVKGPHSKSTSAPSAVASAHGGRPARRRTGAAGLR